MPNSQRTALTRMPERGSDDWRRVAAILDAGFLASVGFSVEHQPYVIPMIYGRVDRSLLLHGSSASRLLGELEKGVPACVCVTLVDGLVLARSAFNHSMNYRSVVAFGVARPICDARAKINALRQISDHLLAGRWNDVRRPNRDEIRRTTVLELPIEEACSKIRQGPPIDDKPDYDHPAWAGVLPLTLGAAAPEPDDHLGKDVELPNYLREGGRFGA